MVDTRQLGTLGDVVSITSGFPFKSEFFGDAGPIPVVRNRDVARGYSTTFYTGPFSEEFVVTDGDLLVSMDGDFRAELWKGGRAILNQRVCRVNIDPSTVDKRFLRFFMPRELRRIQDTTPYATVKHLSTKTIAAIGIRLPSLAKQQRIAAVLDKADAIRRKRRESLRLLDDLLRAGYLALAGPAHKHYREWPEFKVADLTPSSHAMRTGPFGSALRHSEFVDHGVAVLGIDNAVQNRFAWEERRFITEEKYQQFKRYTVRPGDVIITIMGTTGRAAVVPEDIPLAISSKHLAVISVERSMVHPEFLAHAIHSDPTVLAQIAVANRGAIMSGLNLGIIKRLRVRLPPLALQEQFASFVTGVSKIHHQLTLAIDNAAKLFDSLAQRAFRGELEG